MHYNKSLRSKRNNFFENVSCLGLLLFSGLLSAEVTFDGSLGSNATLSAPVYIINADQGKQVGSNLFHSFDTFNINSGEVALFTPIGSLAPIANVMARVTSGLPSNIDGVLSLTIPGANLFFLNSAGVMFGPNAFLNVPGAFHVSTADYIRLENGGRFDTRLNSVNESLTTGSAEAFGFLGDQQPAAIHFEKSTLLLTPPNMQNLTVTGGNISISENSNLIAVGGTLELISVDSAGEILRQNNQLNTGSFSKLGNIRLGVSSMTPGFPVPGHITGNRALIRGGQIVLENSMEIGSTSINTLSNLPAIDLYAAESLKIKGESAKIQVAGSGLKLNLEAKKLSLLDGGHIKNININPTQDNGITIKATDVVLEGVGASNQESGIFAIGKGMITLATDSFQARDGGIVQSEGDSTIMLKAKSIILDGVDGFERSGIFAEPGSLGNSGGIALNTEHLSVLNGARVTTSTRATSTGSGGNLTITAKQILLDGSGGFNNLFDSSIQAETQGQKIGSGNGGDLTINTDGLIVQNKGIISARTRGPGKGGDINIQANTLDLKNQGKISAESINVSPGQAGSISIHVNDSLVLSDNSEITVASELADAGNINITADLLYLKQQSSVTTSVAGGLGKGGDITIKVNPSLMILRDTSKIIANALQGNAGNINIQISSGGALLQSFDSVIEASSQLGIDGSIEINSPDVDIVSGFKPLPEGFLDVAAILQKPCAKRIQNNDIQFINQKYQVLPDSPYALRTFSIKKPLIEFHNQPVSVHSGTVINKESQENLMDCIGKKM